MSAYRRILVAVDGSSVANRGLREAIRLAKADGAQLFILHVVNDFNAYDRMEGVPLGTDIQRLLRDEGCSLLAKAQALAKSEGVKATTVMREVPGGPAADPILREAKKLRADLIVLGTHGRLGLRRIVMGSDAEQVMRGANVPALLVRAAR
jgi:nucleotide-binding universal stress UspA family protein